MKTKKMVVVVVLGLGAALVPLYGAMAGDGPAPENASESATVTLDLFDLFTMSPEQLARAIYAGSADP